MSLSGATTLTILDTVVALARTYPLSSTQLLLERALQIPHNECPLVFVEMRLKPERQVEVCESFTQTQWRVVTEALEMRQSLMLEHGSNVISWKTAVGAMVECKPTVYRRLSTLRPCTLISDALRALYAGGKLLLDEADADVLWPGQFTRKRSASSVTDDADPPRKEMLRSIA